MGQQQQERYDETVQVYHEHPVFVLVLHEDMDIWLQLCMNFALGKIYMVLWNGWAIFLYAHSCLRAHTILSACGLQAVRVSIRALAFNSCTLPARFGGGYPLDPQRVGGTPEP